MFNIQNNIMMIIRMNRGFCFHTNCTIRKTRSYILPERKWIPFRPVGGAVFKRAVLNKFGIKSAIGRIIDIFKKQTKKIGADFFPSLNILRCYCKRNKNTESKQHDNFNLIMQKSTDK